MNNKGKNEERDARMVELRGEGLSFSQIAGRMRLTASCVAGALDRWDRKIGRPKRTQGDIDTDRSSKARENNREKRAKNKPLPHQKLTFAQGVKRPPTITPSARTILERGAQHLREHPVSTAPQLPRYATKKAPDDAVPFQKRKANGCTWTYGGDGEPYLQCNRPRCQVEKAGGLVLTVPYCAEHWDARRATKHTRIIAA